ncbi:nucleotide-binding universal stress UspA family protein [Actimicrobium sp. GrIS 1.19]|uniref:universal stress protein n=1 Tax=Actimicrobium sp. GrIS 1.19 TaxID=3071708 RepID=UPI002E025186|nr:nucleotide-binding universal stress UspA family protein [Actimicrobium sp. GrIS 1.19]
MFKTILVPTDGSPLSDKAVNAAIEFARLSGGKIIGLSVAEPYPYSPLSEGAMSVDAVAYQEKMLSMAQQHVKTIAEVAAAAGVPYETCVAQSFSPYEEIINVANNKSCDVIFMASHGRKGLNRLFVGSETQKVLAHTMMPVMVFR